MRNWALESHGLRFKYSLHCLLAAWIWARSLSFLSLSFLICAMVLVMPVSRGLEKGNIISACSVLAQHIVGPTIFCCLISGIWAVGAAHCHLALTLPPLLSSSQCPPHHASCREGLSYDSGHWPLNWVIVLFSSILTLSLWYSFIKEPTVCAILSYFLYSWCSGTDGLTALGEPAPRKALQSVEIAKGWPGKVPLHAKSNSEPRIPSSIFIQFTHQANILSALNHPRTGARQLGAVPRPLSWLEVLKPATSLYPALSFTFPVENAIKVLV